MDDQTQETEIWTQGDIKVFADLKDYLEREYERHREDEMTAKGKKQECSELLERVKASCPICGTYIWSYSSTVESHIADKHPNSTWKGTGMESLAPPSPF